jgi:hypothetical protein
MVRCRVTARGHPSECNCFNVGSTAAQLREVEHFFAVAESSDASFADEAGVRPWLGYSWANSNAACWSPIRRAPAQISSAPTRCRERGKSGDWSSSLTVGCPLFRPSLRRSSCLALARARSNSGCIGAPWERRRSIDGRCDSGRGAAAPSAPKSVKRRPYGARPCARCWSARQSAITRGGAGAQHRHLTVRRTDLHVHLLSARVGVVIKTYRRHNGERFEEKRNERAPRSVRRGSRCGPRGDST